MGNSNNWSNSQCMACVVDKNKKTRQCLIKSKKDFCKKHINRSTYYDGLLDKIKKRDIKMFNVNIVEIKDLVDDYLKKELLLKFIRNIKNKNKFLNCKFKYTLMNLHNSWNDIPFENQILMDNEFWDVDILINHINHQLNNSNMENPYPIYPNNPFTRLPFSPESLIKLYKRLEYNKYSLNTASKLLLMQHVDLLKSFYDEAMVMSDRFSCLILDLYKQKLRFQIINQKNSQDLYIGLWINKNCLENDFEKLYKHYKDLPYQIYADGLIISNPYKDKIGYLLSNLPKVNYDLNNKKYCENFI